MRALCVLGPAFAAHADFSWQISGLVGQADRSQQGAEFESDLVALSGTYHFDVVEDGSGPHALAAFFDPSTQLSVAASEDRQTSRVFGPGVSAEVQREVSDYSLSGVYLFPESLWYAGGRYSRPDIDALMVPPPPPGLATTTDTEVYALVAGKYFGMGGTRLQLSLEQSKTQNESFFRLCAPTCVTVGASAESITDTARLDVMHVRRFRSATYALLGGISETQGRIRLSVTGPIPVAGVEPEPFNTYFVGAELYPVPTIGVRLGYTRSDGPVSEDEDLSVGASWFFRRNVGLELTLSREDSEIMPRTERATLRAIGRL